MKKEEITILSCKFGKTIKMGYHHIAESKNYEVEDNETPHPDLRKVLQAFNVHLAEAHYVTDKNKERFITNGFIVSEKKGVFSLEIKGKLTTKFDEVVNVSSGKIEYEGGDLDNELIADKLEEAREELFAYMFEDKTAQGKLDFKEE